MEARESEEHSCNDDCTGCMLLPDEPSLTQRVAADRSPSSTSSYFPEGILSTSEISSVGEELGLDLPLAGDDVGASLTVDAVLKCFLKERPESLYVSYKNQVRMPNSSSAIGSCRIAASSKQANKEP